MNKRIPFFTLILLLFASIGRAQYDQTNVFNSFGSELDNTDIGSEISVDEYTGTAKIDFSLFKYRNSNTGLQHELTLGYDAHGVKVDNQASWCGQNWSMNLGGMIVREIKGLPDEDVRGFNNLPAVPTSFNPYDTVLLGQYLVDSLDGQFDIYHYNAGNAAGSFVIGKNGQIEGIPQTNVKIEKEFPVATFPNCHSYFFKITLENGTCYHFSTFNCADIHYVDGITNSSTQWYLTKIVAPFNQDSIILNYERTNAGMRKAGVNFVVHSNFIRNRDQDAQNVFCKSQGAFDLDDRNWRPASVHYPDGTDVIFHYDVFSRVDLYTSNALNNLEINYNNGQVVRGFEFNYQYTVRSLNDTIHQTKPYLNYSGTGVPLGYSEEELSLQLTDFNEYSGQQRAPGYHFKYNEQTLPPRYTTYGVDFWGYYNGVKTKDTYGEPTESRFPVAKRGSAIDYEGGYRLPSLQYAAAKSLEQIELPTGGKVKFVYELHGSDDPATPNVSLHQGFPQIGGLRVKQMIFSDGLSQNNDRKKSYEYLREDNTSSGVMVNSPVMSFVYYDYYTNNGPYHHPLFPCHVSPLGDPVNVGKLLVRTGVSLNHLIESHGNPVGYDRVTAYDGTPNDFKKKIVYEFTTNNDFAIPVSLLVNTSPFPYIPNLDFAWGLPKKIQTFSAADVLLSEEINEWNMQMNTLNTPNFKALKVGYKHYPLINIDTGFDWTYTYPITGRVQLKRKIATSYFNARQSISRTTKYSYDPVYSMLKSVETVNSLGESIVTDYYYPFDFNLTTGAIGLFKVKGNVFSKVRSESWNTTRNQLLNVDISDYDVVNGAVKMKKAYQFTPAQPVSRSMWGNFNPNSLLQGTAYLTEAVRNEAFNATGNPTQATAKGQSSSTIWGYRNTVPVATVANAKIADIAFTSFENAQDWGSWVASNPQPSNFVSNNAITGESSFTIGANQSISRQNLNSSLKYIFTGWTDGYALGITVTTPTGNINVVPTLIKQQRGWNLYRAEVSNATAIYIGFGINSHKVDELRLYPEGALMSTITYRPLTGPLSECDAGNRVLYYEYDDLGQPKAKRDGEGNIIELTEYKFQETQN